MSYIWGTAMGRGSSAFKEVDVRRAIRAVKAAGQPVKGVSFTKEGFTVVVGEPDATTNQTPAGNSTEWKERIDKL